LRWLNNQSECKKEEAKEIVCLQPETESGQFHFGGRNLRAELTNKIQFIT